MTEQDVFNILSNPGSPLALGTLLYGLLWLLTDTRIAPYLARVPYLGAMLDTPLGKRTTAVILALGPGLAFVLSEHMAWNEAARTALLSFAWSQMLKLLEKRPGAAATLLVCAIALTQTACGGVNKETLERGLNGAADALIVSKPCVAAAMHVEESACGADNDCLSAARARWDAILLGIDAFGCLLCTIDSEAEGCAEEKPCEAFQ